MKRRKVLSGMSALIGGALLGSHLPIQAEVLTQLPTPPDDPIKPVRKIKELSGTWKFQVDIKEIGEKESWFRSSYADADWGPGLVPQAWDCYEEALWEYEGVAWYKTTIQPGDLDPKKLTILRFQRVMQYSKVWINGKYVGENIGGYLPFEFDVSSFLESDTSNTLTVRVDNRPHVEWLPAARDIEWIQYGGILGKVMLTGIAHTYIEDLTITTRSVKDIKTVNCKVSVRNSSLSDMHTELEIDIVRDKVVVKKSIALQIPAGAQREAAMTIDIPDGKLWSPDSPVLYTAVVRLKSAGVIIDGIHERFGIRTVSVEGTKILLNGKPLLIKGVNRYDDYGRMGNTVPEKTLRDELAMIKSTGVNMIRVHYPQSPDLLSLYDEYGFVMMEEIPFCWWGGHDDPQTLDILKYAKPALSTMIKRDKNHPCIIIWSMCNECITVTEAAIKVLSDLLIQAKSLDPSRLVTYVLNGYEDPAKSKAYEKADVIVINKYNGTLQGEVCSHISDIEEMAYQPFMKEMTRHRKDCPDKPMFMGEFGTQGIKNMFGDLYYSEDFQVAYIEKIWAGILELPAFSGGILWCWADYYHRKYLIKYAAFGPYGVVTTDRKPKKAFAALKRMYTR